MQGHGGAHRGLRGGELPEVRTPDLAARRGFGDLPGRRMRLLPILFVGVACLGADWPQKGDTVYVSGALTGDFAKEAAPGAAQMATITVPACVPLWTFKTPKSDRVTVADASRSAYFAICGEWHGLIHRTESECKSADPVVFQKTDARCYRPAAD